MGNLYKLSELFNMQMGKTPARNNSKYWDNGLYPWISISDFSNNGKFIKKTKEKIENATKPEIIWILSKHVLEDL